ncbi:hypothetical protein HDU85_006405 [Gaertneriomyces sp. JEL0708]|nr:hypothetical protein HDU85_006405 [Gaertneriomyces sp. JEL0708]
MISERRHRWSDTADVSDEIEDKNPQDLLAEVERLRESLHQLEDADREGSGGAETGGISDQLRRKQSEDIHLLDTRKGPLESIDRDTSTTPSSLKSKSLLRGKRFAKLQSSSRNVVTGSSFVDPAFAAEIDSSLLSLCRSLQYQLETVTDERRILQEDTAKLEAELQSMRRLTSKEVSDRSRLEERSWDLEIANQRLQEQLAKSEAESRKLNARVKHLDNELQVVKTMYAERDAGFCALKVRLDAEVSRLRKKVATLAKERQELATKYEEVRTESENISFPRQTAPSPRSSNAFHLEIDTRPASPSPSSNLPSPERSPSKSQSLLLMGSLSSSFSLVQEELAVAHEELAALRDRNNQLLDENFELQRLLAQAQETAEAANVDIHFGDSVASTRDGQPLDACISDTPEFSSWKAEELGSRTVYKREPLHIHKTVARNLLNEFQASANVTEDNAEGRFKEVDQASSPSFTLKPLAPSEPQDCRRPENCEDLCNAIQNDEKIPGTAAPTAENREPLDACVLETSEFSSWKAEELGLRTVHKQEPPRIHPPIARNLLNEFQASVTATENNAEGRFKEVDQASSPSFTLKPLASSEPQACRRPETCEDLCNAIQNDEKIPVTAAPSVLTDTKLDHKGADDHTHLTPQPGLAHIREAPHGVLLRLPSVPTTDTEIALCLQYGSQTGESVSSEIPRQTPPTRIRRRAAQHVTEAHTDDAMLLTGIRLDMSTDYTHPRHATDTRPTLARAASAPDICVEHSSASVHSPMTIQGREIKGTARKASMPISVTETLHSHSPLLKPFNRFVAHPWKKESPLPWPMPPPKKVASIRSVSPVTVPPLPAAAEESRRNPLVDSVGISGPSLPEPVLDDQFSPSRSHPVNGPTDVERHGKNHTHHRHRPFKTLEPALHSNALILGDACEEGSNSRNNDSPHDKGVESLTYTMIGSWFQKFNRHDRKPQLRYFWINPYSRALNWAVKPPSQGKKSMQTKTAFIVSLSWGDPERHNRNYPPGPEHALIVKTPHRSIKMVPTSWYDHEHWVAGLKLLLERSHRPRPLHEQFGFTDNESRQDSTSGAPQHSESSLTADNQFDLRATARDSVEDAGPPFVEDVREEIDNEDVPDAEMTFDELGGTFPATDQPDAPTSHNSLLASRRSSIWGTLSGKRRTAESSLRLPETEFKRKPSLSEMLFKRSVSGLSGTQSARNSIVVGAEYDRSELPNHHSSRKLKSQLSIGNFTQSQRHVDRA